MKKIFAVTINYNSAKETHEWIASMSKVSKKNFSLELIVVDNASQTPFTLEKNEKELGIHLIRSEVNTGFTGGNNIGIQYALGKNADYILIINNDTLADKNLVEELFNSLEKNALAGMASPKIYFAKGHEFHHDRYSEKELGHVFWYAGGHTDWSTIMSIHRGVDEVDHGQYDKEEKITFASGCCMLIKRQVLEKVGEFDDSFFLYFEDADLNERILRAGYTILYVPTAVLWHITSASTGGSGSNLQDYFLTRNRMLFGMRYAPLRSKIALLRESMRFLIGGRPMQKKGIRDFYSGRMNKGTYFKK